MCILANHSVVHVTHEAHRTARFVVAVYKLCETLGLEVAHRCGLETLIREPTCLCGLDTLQTAAPVNFLLKYGP